MDHISPQDAHSRAQRRARAQERIIAPVADQLRRAGLLSVGAGLIWPFQAAIIAWLVQRWANGRVEMGATALAVVGFVGLAAIRAMLDHRAGALLHRAADQTIARERAALIRREARATGPQSSAAVAALLVQKLPLLYPWITRYHVAMTRVRILPLLLLLVAFSLSWVVGLTLLVAGPLIPLFMALIGMAAEDASRRQLDEIGTMNGMLMERLSALLDIRLLGGMDAAVEDFSARADGLRVRTMAVLRIAFLSSTLLELFAALGIALVAVFVGFTLLGEIGFGSWGTPLSLGEGVFLLLIAPEFFQPLRDLAAAWHDRAGGVSVVAELDALDAAERAPLMGAGTRAQPLSGAFSVRSKAARVERGHSCVTLPDLHLGAGESVALVGPSGAGKTTTLMALAGLMPLKAGQIQICGQVLDAATADAWRARIAFVPQRPHFPNAPLATWLDPRGTGADPRPALELAQADGVVDRLPDRLQTRLGQDGGGVSGGEARRLMLARAMMAGGDFVLADEPTADLDPETAARVITALKRLQQQGRAVLVATHDPALAHAMDRQVETVS